MTVKCIVRVTNIKVKASVIREFSQKKSVDMLSQLVIFLWNTITKCNGS